MDTSAYGAYREHLLLDSVHAPGGLLAYYADGDEEIIHANQYIFDLLECETAEEALELTGGSFRGFVCSEDLDVVEDAIRQQAKRHDGTDHVRYRVRTKSGRLVSVDDFGRLVRSDGERPVYYVTVYAVMQDHPVDWLTGLPSMSRFHELAEESARSIVAEGGKPVAIALNLMGMKAYNALHGREEGDELLRMFSDALRRHFGSRSCSRFAEDHFYALCEQSMFWDKVNALFADFDNDETHVYMPVRVGAYTCEDDDDIVAIGFDRAKLACDLDRKTWQSHVTWFTESMRDAERQRIHLIGSLDQAMREGWIHPYYQPIVRAATSDVCGEEALARWRDPQYGDLLPGQFFSIIEEAGLSYKLDMHIVDCVIEDMAEKRRQQVPIVPVSINISARDLTQINVARALAGKADAAGIPRELLRVELSESAVTSNMGFLKEQVLALHDAGFEVWLDDFGTGRYPLNLLHELEVDLVKLDASFLRGQQSARMQRIIEGIVQTAGKLGVGTIAEGVETEEQALFLEGVGCDMLQGYYYEGPQSLEQVVEEVHQSTEAHREASSEADYWESVSLLNLIGFSTMLDPQMVDGIPAADFPAGVVECRHGSWRLIRSNPSFRELLMAEGVIPQDYSSLRAARISIQRLFPEFFSAVDRCSVSGNWERIPGGLEYGSGYQYYVKTVATVDDASAYEIMAIPTLLGTALGAYGDVPVAYAVFRVILSDAGDEVVDAEYVYANEMYCDWRGFQQKEIVGRSFLEVSKGSGGDWFPYCYRAAVLGEHVHDVVYSTGTQHWLSFYIAPSSIPGYCVYAFAIADDERREREEMIVGRDTSDLIIDIANEMNAEPKYKVALSQLLERMSEIVHADRLYVFEREDMVTNNVFEWCAPGVDSVMGDRQHIPNSDIDSWEASFSDGSMTVVPEVSRLHGVDERLYSRLDREGVQRMLLVPCYVNGRIVGYMGADNYAFGEDLDTQRLLQTIASFVGARIANHRLVNTLESASMHDGLTGLLNRRGVDITIDELIAQDPKAPYVLALMDVDDFKTVNDVHGHDVGDEALRSLARVVRQIFPEGTVLGRNGGDEFLALICGEDVARADQIIEELSRQEKYCVWNGERYHLSMSIGYVEYPSGACSLQDAYTKADAALYSVKLAGKSGSVRYQPKMEDQYRSQLGFAPRDIAENLPGSILVHRVGGEGEILYANDELVRLFACDDLTDFMSYTGGVFKGVVHPDDRERVLNKLGAGCGCGVVDFRILAKNGNVCHVTNRCRLVEVEDMGTVCYELMLEDRIAGSSS